MRYTRLGLIAVFVALTCAFSAARAQAQAPPGVSIPPIVVPPINIPPIAIPPIAIPPISIPPITIPQVPVSPPNIPALPSQTTVSSPATTGLPPLIQALRACTQSGGTAVTIAACVSEAVGRQDTAQLLRAIDGCIGAADAAAAACIADALGANEAATVLRVVDACRQAGGGDAAIAACVDNALGFEQNATAQSSSMVSTCTTSSSAGSQVTICSNQQIVQQGTTQAVLNCFGNDATGPDAIVCAVGTTSPEQAPVVQRVFTCLEAFRQQGDVEGLLACIGAAVEG